MDKNFIISPNSIKNINLLPDISKLKDLIVKIWEKKFFFFKIFI